jgi:YbgC/YbaW family acyl-CoA thioester hydrolase
MLSGMSSNATHERFHSREFVRWSDVDKAGIICYGAYVRFFEIAETELFRSVGYPYSKLFDHFDLWLPRKQLHFEFHAPALLDDLLEIEAWIGKIGRTSLRLEFATYRCRGDERVMTCDGHVVMVATDREELRPKPLPGELVALLERYRMEPE